MDCRPQAWSASPVLTKGVRYAELGCHISGRRDHRWIARIVRHRRDGHTDRLCAVRRVLNFRRSEFRHGTASTGDITNRPVPCFFYPSHSMLVTSADRALPMEERYDVV